MIFELLNSFAHVLSFPSALARGFEWGIYSHDMRTYVSLRMYVSVTLRNVAMTSRWNVAVSRFRA